MIRLLVPVLLFVLSFSVFSGERVLNFGANPGALNMYRYVPAQLANPAPLVVILHGCTQNGPTYETETGWAELADRWGFALVIAEQTSSNNQTSCFNWFENGDISRGSGEARSLISMIDHMKANFAIADDRVYVSGFSAGAAMAVVMLATYPEVFAGGAFLAGVPYRCGTGLTDAFNCMNPGRNLTPQQWGNLVRNASSFSGDWPVVSIWHGDGDFTVRPANADELVDQWTDVHGVDQVADVEDTVKGYPHKVWTTAAGVPVVESYTITGMGHAHPVDPGPAEDQGGTTGGFTQDRGIFAAYFIARFFGLDDSDSEATTVALTAPAAGAVVSGSVNVTALASDNVGVDRVEFFVDGKFQATDDTAPYAFAWDTTAVANGDHVLMAKAYDAAGNSGVSMPVEVVVTGGIEDVTPPSVDLTFPGDGDTLSGSATLTATASDDFGVTGVEFFVDSVSIGEGFPSGEAGPWALVWNTTAVADGTYGISVTARDAKGNTASDGPVTITVDQTSAALRETFADRDSNGDALQTDLSGWSSATWVADTDNHTMDPAGGGSVRGRASSGLGCSAGLDTRRLTLTGVVLGNHPELAYVRKLDINSRVNFLTTAGFRVLVDGQTVDEVETTYDTYSEDEWTERILALDAFAGQTVDLDFEVWANSNICLEVFAEALIDDVRIGNRERPADTTPPVVNLTAPLNGAVVSGSVDITATASDDGEVAKVEFTLDGALLAVDDNPPYEFTWDSTSAVDGSRQIVARAYDSAGNTASDAVTITLSNGGGTTPTTLTFTNADSQDGYVKATATGGAPVVGSSFMENFYGLAIGRGSDGKFNRAFLSFDTSAIPAGAIITRAYLRVTRNSASADPWANGNLLVIDVNSGCIGSCSTATSDWGAALTASEASNLLNWTNGQQTSGDFNAAGLAAINTGGTTQLRLRFADNQSSTAYIFIDNGASAELTVVYQ